MNDQVACNLDALRTNEAWLRPLLRSLVGDHAADDVLQETWLRAWRSPPRVAAATGAWLARVATRLALTHRRSEARRQRHEGAVDAAASAESTQATVDRLALQRAVSLAVAELPEPYRTAVLLHHYHGLDVATIAARTSATAANVRQRLHRARLTLRERLARDLGGDWRRAPAIVAVLAAPHALAPATGASAVPLLLTMNKARLVVVSLAACALFAGALLAPQWLARAPSPSPRETATRSAAGAPASGDAPIGNGIAPSRSEVAATQPVAPAQRIGIVVDVHATPVAGVEIGLRTSPDAPLSPRATSDAAGRFPLPPEWPRTTGRGITATSPWIVLAARPPADGASPVDARVIVTAGRHQVVRVADERGQPLGGTAAAVRCWQLADFPLPLEDTVEARWPPRSNGDDGVYEWTQLPVGMTVVTVSKPGFAPATLPIDATTPAEASVVLHALATGAHAVSGVVTDARGAYVAGARVGLGEWTTTSGAFGEYTLRFEAGAHIDAQAALFAAHAGWVPARVERFGAELATPDATSLTRDLQLTQRALAIRGRVLGHDGAPCRGVHVYPWELPEPCGGCTAEDLALPADAAMLALSGNKIRAFATTGDDGAFVLNGLGPRSYRLRVWSEADGWAWTSGEVAAGTDGALLQLPCDPMGPVAGRVLDRDGRPAIGVRIKALVDIHANGGGRIAVDVQVDATVDEQGRFRIEHMPRLGTTLSAGGEGWIGSDVRVDGTRPYDAIDITVLRRCHVRIECTGAAWSDARAEFLDAAGARLMISERRRSTEMFRQVVELHDGRTGVLAVSEAAVTLVLHTSDGKREQRVPVTPRAGDVTAIVNSVQ